MGEWGVLKRGIRRGHGRFHLVFLSQLLHTSTCCGATLMRATTERVAAREIRLCHSDPTRLGGEEILCALGLKTTVEEVGAELKYVLRLGFQDLTIEGI